MNDVLGTADSDDDDAPKAPVTPKAEEPVKKPEACSTKAAAKKDAEEPMMDPMPISAPEAKGVEISIKVQSKKKTEEEPSVTPAVDDVPATVESKVDTDILTASIDGIEMEAGMMTAEDIGEMTDEEKSRLSQLFSK